MILAIMAIFVVVGVIALLVGMPLFRFQMYRELTVVGLITMLGRAVSVIQIFDLPVPNPTHVIGLIFEPVVKIMQTMLK